MNSRDLARIGFIVIGLAQAIGPVGAQSKPEGSRLVITVVDPAGAIIPGAVVAATARDVTAAPLSAATTATGIATFADLTPGRYDVRAEFEGFDPGTLTDVRVRAGE